MKKSIDTSLGIDTVCAPSVGFLPQKKLPGLAVRPDQPSEMSLSVVEMQGTWYVAQVKWREEQRFAEDLARLSIHTFYPQEKYKLLRTKEVVQRPLFPGYVFFCGIEPPAERIVRYQALMTGRTINILDVNLKAQDQLIKELSTIEKIIGIEKPIAISKFRKGSPCVITKGPFMGCEGFVETDGELTKFSVSLSILGQALSVEIDPDIVEAR